MDIEQLKSKRTKDYIDKVHARNNMAEKSKSPTVKHRTCKTCVHSQKEETDYSCRVNPPVIVTDDGELTTKFPGVLATWFCSEWQNEVVDYQAPPR